MGKCGTKNCFLVLVHKTGLEDTRRLIHSLKVGLALTLASLLVLLKDPYTWIGQNAIWAVITVVVVFETSAGATLGKGLNRGIGTVLAGLLALGAAHLADLLPEPGEPIFIGAVVFVAGTLCTYIRAIPKVKKKFDYSVVIFILTFCMVLVTGYRVGDEVTTASDRLLTIMIGGLICLMVSSFLVPHWAGEDLHRLAAENFHKIANALEECVREYLSGEAQPITSAMIANQIDVDPVYNACRDAVKSRSIEESLAVFASWEPPHGRFSLGYPWKQYLTVGSMLRHCAYSVIALHGCLRSEIQAPNVLRMLFAIELRRGSQDAADLLHELGDCIRTMRKPKGSTTDILRNITRAAEDIRKSITEHSYLLATPESWTALEVHLEDHVSVTRMSKPESGTVPQGQNKLANPIRIPPEAATSHQVQCSEKLVKSVRLDNDDQELLQSAVKVATEAHLGRARDNTLLGILVDEKDTTTGHRSIQDGPIGNDLSDSQSEALPKDEPWPNSITAHKQVSVLREGGALSCYSDGESNSSSRLMTKLSSSLGLSVTNRRDDIASALSLVTFASLLVECLARLDHVVEAVKSLSKSGRFKTCTCGPRLVHVEEDCKNTHSVREDDCQRCSSGITDRELRLQRDLKSFKNSSRHLPTGIQVSVE